MDDVRITEPYRAEIVDPLQYREWDELVSMFAEHTIFHSSYWLRILHESYRYKIWAVVVYGDDTCVAIVPVADIRSFFTGRRGVTLPFSDFVHPLDRSDGRAARAAFRVIADEGRKAGWKGYELHGDANWDQFQNHEVFYHHYIDLDHSELDLYRNMDASRRRNVKKSRRHGVEVVFSQSVEELKSFYRLNCLTRKKHGLPPQPWAFFAQTYENIIRGGHGCIVEARFNHSVIGSYMLFFHGSNALYKFGASDEKYLDLRPNDLLMWETIKKCRNLGYKQLSLGRTRVDNYGLCRFKQSWGTVCEEITYSIIRFSLHGREQKITSPSGLSFVKLMPVFVLRAAGKVLYRHFA